MLAKNKLVVCKFPGNDVWKMLCPTCRTSITYGIYALVTVDDEEKNNWCYN